MSEQIKALRKKAGLTQTEISEKLGMTQSNYALLENGKTELTYSKMQKLAEVFRVSVGELLGLNEIAKNRATQLFELQNKANAVDNDVDDKQKQIDVLQKENEALKKENELLTKLNKQYESENHEHARNVFSAVISCIFYMNVDMFYLMIHKVVISKKELKNIKDLGIFYYNHSQQEYIIDYIPKPEMIDDYTNYQLVDILDLRGVLGAMFKESWVQYFFDKIPLKGHFWKEAYTFYKKPDLIELAKKVCYREEANRLYSLNEKLDKKERNKDLLIAWDFAEKNYEKYLGSLNEYIKDDITQYTI